MLFAAYWAKPESFPAIDPHSSANAQHALETEQGETKALFKEKL